MDKFNNKVNFSFAPEPQVCMPTPTENLEHVIRALGNAAELCADLLALTKPRPVEIEVTDEMLAAGAKAFMDAFDAGPSGGGLPSIYRAMAAKDPTRK